MEEVRKQIIEAEDACLWLSGGKDSRLLLEIAMRVRPDLPILRFETGWSREQREIVDALTLKHDLTVYTYFPTTAALVGDGKGIALAAHYAINRRGTVFPLLSDIVPGKKCSFDLEITLSEQFWPPVFFKTHIIGSKRNETHFALAGRDAIPGVSWQDGDAMFLAPLYEWTDSDVLAALTGLGIDYKEPSEELDTGNIACCTACLKEEGEVWCPKEEKTISATGWSPQESLREWQKLVGVAV
jgi:3'-phosphoadenosine 5'-phosphosulfate sulfotransferase (PAPS reductase)/FAD synthetase